MFARKNDCGNLKESKQLGIEQHLVHSHHFSLCHLLCLNPWSVHDLYAIRCSVCTAHCTCMHSTLLSTALPCVHYSVVFEAKCVLCQRPLVCTPAMSVISFLISNSSLLVVLKYRCNNCTLAHVVLCLSYSVFWRILHHRLCFPETR